MKILHGHSIYNSVPFSIRTEWVFSGRVEKYSGIHSAGYKNTKHHWSSMLTSDKFIVNPMRNKVVTYLFKKMNQESVGLKQKKTKNSIQW